MSIDADVRAGLIDFETARKRRAEMQIESRFYGALDGAMKFIKGDAIAGLVIIIVNIVGGLAAGILIEQLDLFRAVSKYTLLSVGDGMLSQIPALLNALAAGLVVTRVGRNEGETLAHELLGQIWQVRKAKIIIGFISCMLGFAPGMPALPFFFLAAALFLSAVLAKPKNCQAQEQREVKFEPKIPPLLEVELNKGSAASFFGKGVFQRQIDALRQEIYDLTGLIIAVPGFSIRESPDYIYRISMRGIVAAQRRANGGSDVLSALIQDLRQLIFNRSEEFVGDILTRRTLDQIEKESPELVAAVVPEVVSVTQLTEVLKALVQEKISIRNFDLILQAIAEQGKGSGSRLLVEEVRVALKRVISTKYGGGNGSIKAYFVDPAIDLTLAKAEREGGVLDPGHLSLILDYLEARDWSGGVVVVSKGARRLLKECLSMRKVEIPVLAHEELAEDVEIEEAGRIEIEDDELEDKLFEQLAA